MKSLFLAINLLMVGPAVARDGGFLFVTFNSESTPLSEQIYFGLSKDGLNWEALNGARPVLVSALGEKGARDPYILRSHDGKKFYLLATDLSINRHPDWHRAVQAGSRSLVIWDSEDLVHWSEPRLVSVAPADAGCAWAPEAIYDEDTHDYLVFWASPTARDHFAKQRIWAAQTTDFITFGPPFLYVENQGNVIDADIVKAEGKYYRFSKDETHKAIKMEVSDQLIGHWRDVPNFSLASMVGYEGPECFLLEPAIHGHPPTWCLILDYYSRRGGYTPFVSHDLATGQFTRMPAMHFPFKFRHGFPLAITADEYSRLKAAYGEAAPAR